MIYLDVTGICESPMNTGVQRTGRAIFENLNARTAVLPLLWNRRLQSYCRLSARESEYLHAPFRTFDSPLAEPRHHPYPLPWSRFAAYLANRRNRLDLATKIAREDTLLVPAAFLDNRIHLLPEMKSRTHARHVAIFHDAIALRLPEFTGPRPKARFRFYIRSLSTFDLVICVSREAESDLRRYWAEFGHPAAPTCVESWPVDFPGAERGDRPNFDARRILSVGTFECRKNHLRLLEAAESLWAGGLAFELQLIGQTTRHWGEKVLATISRLQKAGRSIAWLKHVNDDALHRAYRECSFTVFPSVSEGFGLPILESLWHRRPCACGQNGALGEIAGVGGCLTIDQLDASSIADAMRRLLTDRALYEKLHREAFGRKFRSWDDYAESVLQHATLPHPRAACPLDSSPGRS